MGQDLCLEKFVEASTPKFGEILRNDSQMLNESRQETGGNFEGIRTKKFSQECGMNTVE